MNSFSHRDCQGFVGFRSFLERFVDCVCVFVCVDKRGVDVKLSSAQALLHEQDESLRRGERERRALNERIKELERLCLSAEAERRRVEVRGHVHLRPRLHCQ